MVASEAEAQQNLDKLAQQSASNRRVARKKQGDADHTRRHAELASCLLDRRADSRDCRKTNY
jgi:hypothetical protein